MDEPAIPPSQPFLFLTKESRLHPKLVERFETTAESYWVVVHGAAHDSFTDSPLLRSLLIPGPNQAEKHRRLIQNYALAFLDTSLKWKTGSLLSASEGEDVTVRVFRRDTL